MHYFMGHDTWPDPANGRLRGPWAEEGEEASEATAEAVDGSTEAPPELAEGLAEVAEPVTVPAEPAVVTEPDGSAELAEVLAEWAEGQAKKADEFANQGGDAVVKLFGRKKAEEPEELASPDEEPVASIGPTSEEIEQAREALDGMERQAKQMELLAAELADADAIAKARAFVAEVAARKKTLQEQLESTRVAKTAREQAALDRHEAVMEGAAPLQRDVAEWKANIREVAQTLRHLWPQLDGLNGRIVGLNHQIRSSGTLAGLEGVAQLPTLKPNTTKQRSLFDAMKLIAATGSTPFDYPGETLRQSAGSKREEKPASAPPAKASMRIKLDQAYQGWASNEQPLGPGVVEVDEALGRYLVDSFDFAHEVPGRLKSLFARA